ncbi:MAG: InlB B-repeat-containing protein, partial [Clostridia bacterium]|nr:InlB B-repeat-containing protein [Clostridia bacterium]
DGTETARCDRCNETDTRTADGTKIIPNSYNLTFDSNGGSGAPEKQTGNGSVLIPGSKPTRNGYTFLGWAETADATSTKYQPGGTINLNRNITLYAVWQENNTPENPVNPTENAKLNVKTSQTVDYKSNVTVTATASGVPTGYVLAIYEGNTFRTQGDNTKVSYSVGQMTAGKTFTVKVIDPSTKAVQKDSSGAELNKNCEVKVKTGFFDKLIAFFKGLFGALPNVEVKP